MDGMAISCFKLFKILLLLPTTSFYHSPCPSHCPSIIKKRVTQTMRQYPVTSTCDVQPLPIFKITSAWSSLAERNVGYKRPRDQQHCPRRIAANVFYSKKSASFHSTTAKHLQMASFSGHLNFFSLLTSSHQRIRRDGPKPPLSIVTQAIRCHRHSLRKRRTT